MSSPALIITSLLVAEELLRWPSVDGDVVPVAIAGLPASPPDAVSVNDTAGRVDGRSGGRLVTHPGIQITRRARVYETGYAHLKAIGNHLITVHNQLVNNVPDAADEIVYAVTMTTDVFYIGRVSANGEFLFTVNAVVSLAPPG